MTVYFVQSEVLGLVKIGFTSMDVKKRVAALAVGNPDPLGYEIRRKS